MRISRAGRVSLACGLLAAIAIAFFLLRSEPEPLNTQVVELYNAGKYAEALPLAERYVAAMSARHGPEHAEYATALARNLPHATRHCWRQRDGPRGHGREGPRCYAPVRSLHHPHHAH